MDKKFNDLSKVPVELHEDIDKTKEICGIGEGGYDGILRKRLTDYPDYMSR